MNGVSADNQVALPYRRKLMPSAPGRIPFTYGPLAYVLKNRIYLGQIGHGDKWFAGEHKAIVDRVTFERVQELLKAKRGQG